MLLLPLLASCAPITLTQPHLSRNELIPGSHITFTWENNVQDAEYTRCGGFASGTHLLIVMRDDDPFESDDFVAYVTHDTNQQGYPYLGPAPWGRGGWPLAITNSAGNRFDWVVPQNMDQLQCPGSFEGSCHGELYFQVWKVQVDQSGRVIMDSTSDAPYPHSSCASHENDLPKFSIVSQDPGGGAIDPSSYPNYVNGPYGQIYISFNAFSTTSLKHGERLSFQLLANNMEGRPVKLTLMRQLSTGVTAPVQALFTINGENGNTHHVPSASHAGVSEDVQNVLFTPLASIGTGNFFIIGETSDQKSPFIRAASQQFSVITSGSAAISIDGPSQGVFAVGDPVSFTVRMTGLAGVKVILGMQSQEGLGVVSQAQQEFTIDGRKGTHEFTSANSDATSEKQVTLTMFEVAGSQNVRFVFTAYAAHPGVSEAISSPFTIGDPDATACPAGFIADKCGICGGHTFDESMCAAGAISEPGASDGDNDVGLIVGLSVGGYCLMLLCSLCAAAGMGLVYKAKHRNEDVEMDGTYELQR